MGGLVAAIPYTEGMSFVESIKLLRTGFPMALGIFSEVILAATAIGMKIDEFIDKSKSRRQQDERYKTS